MNLKGLEKARKVVTTALVAALVALFAYGITSLATSHRPAFALTSAADPHFSITSSVDSTYPACTPTTAPARLYPGTQRCLAVTVHNPLSVPLTVTALTMTLSSFSPTSTAPSGTCTAATLPLPTLFTSPFSVPKKTGTATGTTVLDKPIELVTKPDTTQSHCEGGAFHFTFSATGRYTDTTTTTLGAALSGGTNAVLTATVTPANPTSDPYGPASTTAPVHHVTFYACATATCSAKTELPTGTVTLTQTTATTLAATATYQVSGLSAGTHYYEALYPATGTHKGTFTASHSTTPVSVTVSAASCVNVPTTGAHIVLTGITDHSYFVPPFTSVWLDGGTIEGNVVVPAFSSFAATGGTIQGNLSSLGEVSLASTTVEGNVDAAGALGIGPGSAIGGNLTATANLALCVVGTAQSPVSVGGNVSAHLLPFFTSNAQLCAMTVTGNLTYTDNVAPVEVGGGSGCGGNEVGGNLLVSHNLSAVTVGTNTVGGNLTVSFDAGGTLTSNSAGGNCSLGPDFPAVTGTANTVPLGHHDTCDGTA
jgi:hypothetical protein